MSTLSSEFMFRTIFERRAADPCFAGRGGPTLVCGDAADCFGRPRSVPVGEESAFVRLDVSILGGDSAPGGIVRRDPALTFQGALKILGHHDRSHLDKLNSLLGGIILGSGAAAGFAALTGTTALAPAAVIAAIWGWVDQKNEAISLIRKMLDGASERLRGTAGYERHRLVAAAHTTIVAAAYFESLERYLSEFPPSLDDSLREQIVRGEGNSRTDVIGALYEAPVPAPSSTRGFEENVAEVGHWMSAATQRIERLLPSRGRLAGLDLEAVERYRSHYLQLAATVPEFLIWAVLGEHAATRARLGGVRDDLMAALDGQAGALMRVETLLNAIAGHSLPAHDLCTTVHRANRGALDEAIVSADAMRVQAELTLPTV
jgi:hypothetical protein